MASLYEVAAHGSLDDDIFEGDAFGAEYEIEAFRRAFDPDRIVDIAEVRRHEAVIPLDAVEEESPLGIGAGTDGCPGPVDRGPDEGLVVGIAHHAAQVLGTGASQAAQHSTKSHQSL